MSKIKSIKVNQLELDRIVANANNSDLAQLEYLHKINPLLFEIEYESETRYWPNGALFNKPDDDTCVWCVGSSLELKKYVVQTQDHFGDYQMNKVYLTTKCLFDDRAKAEKYAQALNDRMAIERRIQEINFENDWVVDWSDFTQEKWYFWYRHDSINYSCNYSAQSRDIHVCKQAAEWFINTDEFTLEQKKHFINIYD